MLLVSPSDLKQLQAINNANMPETAVIQTGTETGDGSGGTSTTWADTATTVCRISPLSRGMLERVQAMGLEVAEALQLAFPADTAITESQRVKVGTRFFYVGAVLGPISYGSEVTVIGVERSNP